MSTRGGSPGAQEATSILTRMKFAASPERVWNGLMFYEQIDERPPLHLRLLLPVPIGTEKTNSKVGARVRCSYEGGHLVEAHDADRPEATTTDSTSSSRRSRSAAD